MRPRRSFTPEFKAEVVALLRRGDSGVAEICRDMDLVESASGAGPPEPISTRADAAGQRVPSARTSPGCARRYGYCARSATSSSGPRWVPPVDATPTMVLCRPGGGLMAQMGRPGLTVEQKRELWLRWQAGESLSEIGRALGKQPGSIRGVVASNGGYSGRGDAARRRVRTTIPAKKRAPFDDLVARRFVAEAANQLWCGRSDLHTHRRGLSLLRLGDRCLSSPGDRLGDRHAHARRACLRGPAHGRGQPSRAGRRGHLPLR